jgi:cephalosporin hydroxylase
MADGERGGGELERLAGLRREPLEARLERPLRDYWLERVALHTNDSYAGVPLSKFPEDLRLYEHLLWARRPRTVIEIGIQSGASTLWFRDRLRTLAGYGGPADARVIGIDIDIAAARANLDAADPGWGAGIELVEGDVRDPALARRVAAMVPGGTECFVVEDSAHTYETTRAALDGFATLIAPGGFLMVEDGCVDVEPMRLEADWPRGVLPALADWLASPPGQEFTVRRDLETYGVTCHPGGLVQRRAAALP